MISNEVKIGVTTGRIVAVIGPEHRFMMASLLIKEFLSEYQTLIYGYLKRDFGEDKMFYLQMAEVTIQSTLHLLFYQLNPVLCEHKLEPIIEKLDQCFF